MNNDLYDIRQSETAFDSHSHISGQDLSRLFDILSDLGYQNDNQQLASVYESLKLYFINYYSENSINEISEYSPDYISQTLKIADTFDFNIQFDIDFFLTNLQNFQTMDGGFQYNNQKIQWAIENSLPFFESELTNVSKLINWLDANIVSTDTHQGWNSNQANDYVDNHMTVQILSSLSHINSSELDNWLYGTIYLDKILKVLDDYMCLGTQGGYSDVFSCIDQLEDFTASLNLLESFWF